MSWSNPTSPNLADFVLFCQDVMDINPLFLPADSPFPGYALTQALELVIRMPRGGIGYTLAVYNCAGHILLKIAPDQPGRPFFTDARAGYGLLKPSVGVVASSSNNGTSTALAVPDALRQLTLGDLDFMKTPFGREFVAFNQDFGDVFGLT